MLNQININSTSTYNATMPYGDDLIIIVHTDSTDEDEIRISYLDLGSDGVDWDAYNSAREVAFQEAVEFGSVLGATEQELNEYLMKDRVPAETAWRYWQETYIQPALERRNALKDGQGRINLADHNLVEAEFNRSPKVSEIVSDIIKKYPHLKRVDFTEIMESRLPSFGEYWQLRGYSKPKPLTSSARAGQIRGAFGLPAGINPAAPSVYGPRLQEALARERLQQGQIQQ